MIWKEEGTEMEKKVSKAHFTVTHFIIISYTHACTEIDYNPPHIFMHSSSVSNMFFCTSRQLKNISS